MSASEKVIKSFVAKFKVDAKDFDAAISKMGRAVAKITKTIGSAFGSMFNGLKAGIKGAIGLFTGLFDKILGMISSFSDNMGAFLNFDAKSNIDVEYASRFADAMTRVGGSTEDALNTLEHIQQSLVDTKFGAGTLIEAAKKYGLALHDSNGQLLNTENMLLEISKRMQSMTKAEQLDFANTIGLDDASIRLLQKGPEGLKSMMANAQFVVSKDDLKNAEKLRESTAYIKQTFKAIGLDVQRILIPFIAKAIDIIKSIPVMLRKIFLDTEIGKGLTKVLAPAFRWFFDQMRRAKNYLKDLSLKKFISDLPRLSTVLADTLKDGWGKLAELIKRLFSFIKEQGPTIGKYLLEAFKNGFKILEKVLPSIAKTIGTIIGSIIGSAIDIVKWIADNISNNNGSGIINAIGSLLSRIGSLIINTFVAFFDGLLSSAFDISLSTIGNKVSSIVGDIGSFFGIDDKDKPTGPKKTPPVVMPPTYNTSTNNTNNYTINNNITSTNPVAAGRETTRQIKNAVVQTSGGY